MIGKECITIDTVQFTIGRSRCTSIQFELRTRATVQTQEIIHPLFNTIAFGISNGCGEFHLSERPGQSIAVSHGLCGCSISLFMNFGFSLFGFGSGNGTGSRSGRIQFCLTSPLALTKFLDEFQTQGTTSSFISINRRTQER
mmetsp:Transcript_10055/g.28815  ORF Transcript_10055/g.28815 Transcript_10055/m.28815 type:complete len:142 (+) Transcript_10055:261-686(+)